jgi:hypothetical protein
MPHAELNIKAFRIPERIFSKVKKYIEPIELNSIRKSASRVTQSSLRDINDLHKIILRYYPKIKIDSLVLAIILYEMLWKKCRLEREKRNIKLGKHTIEGTQNLLHVLQLYDQQPLNIEKITFKVRSRNPIADENLKSTSFYELLNTKDSRPEHYIISGHEITCLIIDAINSKKTLIDKFLLKERQLGNHEWIKGNLKSKLRADFAKILYRYGKDHRFGKSERDIYLFGGNLLYSVGLLPYRRKSYKTDKEFGEFKRNNFKKAFFSKATV